jgi:Leucine Rich repeats (2 copies)
MVENYAHLIYLTGLAIIVLGGIGFVVRAFRHWRKGLLPLGMIAIGLAITAFPSAYTLLAPIDLGPRDKMVDGERHLTLTGWNRKDYGVLGSLHDTVVLQMANPDVTDRTLNYLKGMTALKELDLNNTQVTDAGLIVLKGLPALQSLRLKNTKITDRGFRDILAGKETLNQLDLTGTEVDRETAQAWRSAKPGRRVLR